MKKRYIIGIIILSVLVLSLFFIDIKKIEDKPESIKIISESAETEIIKSIPNLLDSQGHEIKKDIQSSAEVFDKGYGLTGMEIKEFAVGNVQTDKLNYEDSDKKFRTEFRMLPYSAVEQNIYITNNGNAKKDFNYSTIIEIDYDKIRWNGTTHKLNSIPFKMTSWNKINIMGDNDFIVPQIWFDDVYNKRIDYTDIARKGGYALAYEKDGRYYIELRIDKFNVESKKEYFIDPVFYNDTDGFSMTIAGALLGTPKGIGANTTNVFVADGDVALLKYRRNAGTGAWENATGACTLPDEITGTTVLPVYDIDDGSFWMVNGYQHAHHINNACANQTGYFNIGTITGLGSVIGATNNGTAELWFGTYATSVNGRLTHTSAGVNQTDGFNTDVITGHIGADSGIYALTMNESDFWIMYYEDAAKGYINHIDENHNNMSDGFNASALTGGSAWEGGMTTNGTDIFLADYTNQFVYSLNPNITAYSTTPTVILNYPGNGTNTTVWTQYFNCSATTSLMNITNISFYHNATGVWERNQTYYGGNWAKDSFEFSLNFTTNQSLQWNCYVCNNNTPATECSYSSYNNSFNLKNFIVNSENYSQTAIEGSTQTFYINISNSNREITYAKLMYNGTEYNGTYTSSDNNHTIYRTITIPSIVSAANKSFYWTFKFNDSSIYNSNEHNQTVVPTALDACGVYTNKLFNITMRDEESQVLLEGSGQNTSVKIDFNITTASGIEVATYSNFSNATNPTLICSENALTGSSLRLDGVIEYSSKGRFTEFYHFQNYSLGDDVVDVNISLYNLNSSSGQEFKITYKDDNFVPVDGAILDIQRKYIDEGVYKTTERPKTGTEGYTIGHLVVNNIVYNILVYKEGVLLASFMDLVADCQNPTLFSCSINLNSYGTSIMPESFETSNDITFTLTYDKSTRKVQSVYSINSGGTSNVNLEVTKFDTLGNTSVCNDTLTAAGGTLTCTVPASFGNSTIVSRIYKDNVIIGQSVMAQSQDPYDTYGLSLMFISLILFLTLVGIGITDNPMITGISIILGIVLLMALNLIYVPAYIGTGATILWIIIAVALILIRGSSRQ